MSYLVLARKWRPRSFASLVGQDHVVQALRNALATGRLHHAWLFTGTRGVGKTTLARILAKALNCEQGITAEPCGQCQACVEIDSGRFVDYIELDAASNRGVDEMTQLLEQAVYAPSAGRFKVYMIDEVHMLTGHAFNAMLKTLEEPPAHVKFILATTDPQKIPVTVLSRCLQFNLKQMTVPDIVAYLQHVLAEEAVPAEPEALRLIARAAQGSMRDALSLTDQAISFCSGSLGHSAVSDMLGTLDEQHLLRLAQALAARDATAVLAVADELAARGLSYHTALADLATLLSQVAVTQHLGRVPAESSMLAEIQALAAQLSADEVHLFYTVALHGRQELKLAPDAHAGFIMTCLRMLALLPQDRSASSVPPPTEDTRSDAAAPEAGTGAENSAAFSATATATHTQAVKPDTGQATAPVQPRGPAQGPEAFSNEAVAPLDRAADATAPMPASQTADAEKPAVTTRHDDQLHAETWPEIAASLPLSGSAQALALNSELVDFDGEHLRLRVGIQSLLDETNQNRLAEALSEHLKRNLRPEFEFGQTGEHTAQARATAEQARRQRQAESAAESDALVQALVGQFDARIVPGSVRPSS